MLEFLFGFILGVWAGQSVALPNVASIVETWWKPRVEVEPKSAVEADPVFTGNIPT